MTKVKICGVKDFQTALFCVERGVNYLGFVMSMSQTQRFITRKEVYFVTKELKAKVQQLAVRFVGVFVDEDRELVRDIANECTLDVVQFHGNESPEYCKFFGDRGLVVWKSFGVKGKDVLSETKRYLGFVDAFHLDTYNKGRKGGGFGKKFDWNVALQVKSLGVPVVLSGGLTPANVEDAISHVRPDVVDVSSGVESTRGVKDLRMIEQFIDALP